MRKLVVFFFNYDDLPEDTRILSHDIHHITQPSSIDYGHPSAGFTHVRTRTHKRVRRRKNRMTSCERVKNGRRARLRPR